MENFYGSVSTRFVFTSQCMLPVARKDVLPITKKNFDVYEYKCHCDSRYVGLTSQRLQDRIKQHIPQWLRQQLTLPRRSQLHRSRKQNDTKPECDSAIGQHLLENDQCALNYYNKRFSILSMARISFHLNLLEAAYIKTQRPVLCRQKEFVYTFKLFRKSWRSYLASCSDFLNVLLLRNLSLARFTTPALSLACLNCLTSKLTT